MEHSRTPRSPDYASRRTELPSSSGALVLGRMCLTGMVVFTTIALFAALISTGAGHGDYVWARLLFPYSILSAWFTGSITTPFIVLAFVQYPLYGIIVHVASHLGWRQLGLAAGCISLLHLVAALLCFYPGIGGFG